MSDLICTSQVPAAIELLNQGDDEGRRRLIAYAADRLTRLAAHLLRGNPVQRWENSDDLLQQCLVRLHRSLERARPPDARALLELAALEMRHALIDLARHYYGPLGMGRHYRSYPPSSSPRGWDPDANARAAAPDESLHRAESLEQLYEAIAKLPAEEREVVDLVWLHELSQAEAATLLGITLRTVGRRWRRARLRLFARLRESPAQD